MILIGSRALAIRADFAINRIPRDFDFVCTEDECYDWIKANGKKFGAKKPERISDSKIIVKGSTNCEFEIVKPNTSSEKLVEIVTAAPDTIQTPFGMIPGMNLLFAIKQSHRFKKFTGKNHFWKTAMDWHIMKACGAKIETQHKEFLYLRERETYTNVTPKLNQGKSKFFQDGKIKYLHDHDDIHVSVANRRYNDGPAYIQYLADGEEVMADKDKFFAASAATRQNGVIEEACVLAIERTLVPFPGCISPDRAFMYALSKVCTSITSGWFREFAFENIPSILYGYNSVYKNYWENFQSDLKNGLIKPYTR